MSLVLYHNPASTCSQKVRITLAEKGIPYEEHVMQWSKQDHLADWYMKINPNGVVPSITHDGVPVIDSSVICEYLDEVFAETPLSPRDPVERARMRAWMRYLEEVPTVAIRVPSFNLRFMPWFRAMETEDFDAMVAKMPLRKHFYSEMGQKGFSDERFNESIARLRATMERLDKAVAASGGPYILGPDFTFADVLLIPTVVRMEDLGLSRLWGDLPSAAGWYGAIQARPSFAATYYEGSRLAPEAMTITGQGL